VNHGLARATSNVRQKKPVSYACSSEEHEKEAAQKLGEGGILIELLDVLLQISKREVLKNGGHGCARTRLLCTIGNRAFSECQRLR
jgi:hypothetical protein